MTTWDDAPAFICQRPHCGKITVPIRVLPAICPNCKALAKWRQVVLSKKDEQFLRSLRIDPDASEGTQA
jgi:hypothetical protein